MVQEARPRTARARWRTRAGFPHAFVAGIVVFALQFVHGKAIAFLYDAAQYWNVAVALLQGGDAIQEGVLALRGVLTAVVYLPPALASIAVGGGAGWAVLIWNALLAVVLCVVLLPRIAALVAPGQHAVRIWTSAILGGVLLSGFARYPLLDTWSIALALAGLYGVVVSRRWWTLALSGFSLVFAANLRPSHLVAILLAVAVLAFVRPRNVLWMLPGAALGLVPQLAFNVAAWNLFSFATRETPFLVTVQAAQATYAVRYDTVLFSAQQHPQQFFCDPAYSSRLLGDAQAVDQLGVVSSIFSHLPHSLWFLSEKAAASLLWTSSTPYEPPPGGTPGLFSWLVLAVATAGIVALVWRLVTSWADTSRRGVALTLVAFWFGSLATLVLSTPETRFAMPLVAIGLIGVLCIIPARFTRSMPKWSVFVATAIGVLLTIALLLVGTAAVAHPAQAGPLPSVETCASLIDGTAP